MVNMPKVHSFSKLTAWMTKPSTLMPLGIAFTSGILMALAPAPLNFWWLAWVSLVPLWVLVLGGEGIGVKGQGRAIACAVAWGIGYHGLALSWITGLHPLTWMGVPWLASVAIVLFCWIFITLWGASLVAIWTGGLRWLESRFRAQRVTSHSKTSHPATFHLFQPIWLRILIATALWCSLEEIWSLGSLYWTSLSYTQSPGNLAILHLGQLSGPSVVTAAIVAVNGLLAESWICVRQANLRGQVADAPRGAQEISQKRSKPKLLMAIACLLLLGLHLIGFALYSRPLAQPPETALKVGIIQGNVPTRIKLSEVGVRRAIHGYTNGYRLLARQGMDVVLTPEGALPLLWDESNKQSNPFYQAVVDEQRVAWLGTFVPQGDHITQSLLTLTSTGETYSRYNKIKLVPLGEYIPFRHILGLLIDRLSPIKTDMLPGSADQRFETPFGRAIASICYESAFPELFRAQAATGGEFILTASNLDPYSQVLMAQHQAQDLMRAIETDRWAIRATNTGYSGIINPHGNIQWRSQPHQYQLHADTIYRRQTQTPYVRWGNWLTPLFVGASAIGWVLVRRLS